MNNTQSNMTTTGELKSRDTPAITLSPEADGKDYLSSPRGRTSHLRRQSMSLTAVINHRRGLLGALISGIGSNMSLPSCMPQDQEFLPGQPPGYKIQPPLLNNQPQEKNDYELQRQRPNFLPLAPVNTACVPMSALTPAKTKQQLMDQYTSPLEKRKCHSEMVSIMSTLYAKLLIVVGVAVPVAASVTERVPPYMNQGFYLYLYLVSVLFVIAMYVIVLRDKAVRTLTQKKEKKQQTFAFDEKGDRVNVGQVRHPCPILIEVDISEH